jgi:transcriptional regulator with XRE-family HTH domain
MSKVQIIRDERNEPAYAVVPWAEYKSLKEGRSEEAALIERANAARNDEKFPASVARRLVAGEIPLKAIREWRGLSQSELGKLAGVAPQYISQIERGARNMGMETARKLAPLLGVSSQTLLDDDEPQEVPKFVIGQKYRANKHPSRTAEVMQIDAESTGWKAWVDMREDNVLQRSDWVNYALFSKHWTLVKAK